MSKKKAAILMGIFLIAMVVMVILAAMRDGFENKTIPGIIFATCSATDVGLALYLAIKSNEERKAKERSLGK